MAAAWTQAAHALTVAMIGLWSGTLEYRDYRSDRRVTLPVTLRVSETSPNVLAFAYEYDDGPGKIVRSSDRITIDPAARTYRIQNSDGTYDATFTVQGLAEFGAASRSVVLLGKGDENGVAVDLRITITADGASMTMLRESKQPGGDWLFRNQYTLRR